MTLLERYLSAVERHLPARNAQDIVAELREDIRARFDERSSELGRPLTLDDEAELLKPYGRPVLMAGRYAGRQQLIGPAWLPFYWITLKIALAVALAIQVGLVVLSLAAGRPAASAAGRLVGFPFETAISVFGWVTLVFALLELGASRGRFANDWDPRKLPPPTPVGVPRVSRVETAIELVISAVFATWWVALRSGGDVMDLPGSVALAPEWDVFFLPILVVVLASTAVKCVVLVRPDWVGFRIVTGLVLTAAGIGIAALILAAGPMFLAVDASREGPTLARLLNSLLRWGISIGVAIAVVSTGVDLWRWVRGRARAAATAGASAPLPRRRA